jgi:hypothetical protein
MHSRATADAHFESAAAVLPKRLCLMNILANGCSGCVLRPGCALSTENPLHSGYLK